VHGGSSKNPLPYRQKGENVRMNKGFDCEPYGMSPKNTAGWLARGQQLANVVATEGTIEVNIFAISSNGIAEKREQ
jgi:hypothetical protein